MTGDNQGYSLVELLVVLSIVSLTLALSLPSLDRKSDLHSQATQIAALLRLARTEAILSNSERRVAIDLGRRRLQGDSRSVDIAADVMVTVLTARNEIVKDKASIRFLPNGSSTGGAVSLTRGSGSAQVRNNWLTGSVTLEQGELEHAERK